ncbi:MAG: Ig-like domain-containing protein [Chloroflexi bacterium]|nr:Ig-like domain-containing protein [Chloroflexota bacterium]
MKSQKWRFRVRWAALSAVLLLSTLAMLAWATAIDASSQRVLSVTAYPRAVSAQGGESTITVRLPAAAAENATRVTLSTELGAFTAASGPARIQSTLFDVGNDTLGANVKLVADGRSGATVVTAQVGSLLDTVTVRFVGETSSLRLAQPAANARLDASAQHRIRLIAVDETGIASPGSQVSLQILAAPSGAQLRSGITSSTSELTVRTSQTGEATALLSSEPGVVRIRATSGSASLTMEFELYGEPKALRLVPISGASMEFGKVGAPGSIQALLVDERGQGVPNQRITFAAGGGLVVSWEGDGESQTTDDSGAARVHLDSRSARLGSASLSAAWAGDGRSLSDEQTIKVTGTPVALYLSAQLSLADVEEVLIEEYVSSTRYRLQAEVVDRLGQPVAGGYRVLWRPLVVNAEAQVYPQISVTQGGVATAIFDLEHIDGVAQTDSTWAQALLMAKAHVNNNGLIADLLGDGLPLQASWNDLVWRSQETTVSEAVSDIQHVVSAAWRWSSATGWQAWFSGNVPGAVDFVLMPGDTFHLVLNSAALLQNVERR